jgi:two-component system LytT family sensor kinase
MRYVAVIAGLSLLALDVLVPLALGQPVPGVGWLAFGWAEWILLAPLVIRVATAVPYRRRQLWRFIGIHLVAALAFHVAHLGVFVLAFVLVHGMPVSGPPLLTRVMWWIPVHMLMDFLVYGVTVVATQMSLYLKASARREEERLALEQSLAQAALDRHRLELPVEVVSARLLEIERAIPVDADRAERLIEEFAASLRESLNVASVHAAIDEVAQDEAEWEEELAPQTRQWSLPLRLLLLFSILPAYELLWSVLLAVVALLRGQALSWGPVVWAATTAVEFFPVTLAMVWLGTRVRRVWPLVIAAEALAWLWGGTLLGLWAAAGSPRDPDRALFGPLDPLFFLGIGLAALAHTRYREAAAAAATVAELETSMLRTRATLLRLQLNPHFLFNSLNSVAALLEDDAPTAKRMAAELRHFVVRVLERSDREEVPLREELDSLAAYVAIENIRFGGRAELVIEASDDAQAALVPSFLLQPLVENALRHGLLPEKGGQVSVRAHVRGGEVHIRVDDEGGATQRDLPTREGLGLSNTRARLAQMYGDGFSFGIAPRENGFTVTTVVPYRPQVAALHAA